MFTPTHTCPHLQNLCLSLGDNAELCYCLKSWTVCACACDGVMMLDVTAWTPLTTPLCRSPSYSLSLSLPLPRGGITPLSPSSSSSLSHSVSPPPPWQELPASVRSGGRLTKEEALQAVAVVGRVRRAISEISDRIVLRIGAESKAMGDACGAENWASELFAEEVCGWVEWDWPV
jgi:hypothetical protein